MILSHFVYFYECILYLKLECFLINKTGKTFFFFFRKCLFWAPPTSIRNQKLVSKFRYFLMKNRRFLTGAVQPGILSAKSPRKLRCHFVWVKNCGSLLEQRQIINITTTAANIPNISTPGFLNYQLGTPVYKQARKLFKIPS